MQLTSDKLLCKRVSILLYAL